MLDAWAGKYMDLLSLHPVPTFEPHAVIVVLANSICQRKKKSIDFETPDILSEQLQ